MIRLPIIDTRLINFAKSLNCIWLGEIRLYNLYGYKEWDCHNNTIKYTEMYGHSRICGYYFLHNTSIDKLIGISHSVIKKNDELIDITPFSDSRLSNIFGQLPYIFHKYDNQEFIEGMSL